MAAAGPWRGLSRFTRGRQAHPCGRGAGAVEGDHLFNDVAVAAYRVEPRLGRLVTALSNATRQQAHVTGSGSGVFIPSTPQRIEKLMGRVQRLLASGEEFAGVKAIRT